MSKEREPFLMGKIGECDRYESAHPRFKKAFEFLRRPDLATLPTGRYEIDGDNCWAMVQSVNLKAFAGEKQQAEAHSRYIDIQAPLDGPETFGLYDLKGSKFTPFDEEKDYGLADVPSKPVTLSPGEFIVFFPPNGGHVPCRTLGDPCPRKKLVIKVRDDVGGTK